MATRSSADRNGGSDETADSAATGGCGATALAGGCGGDDGAKALSKSQFIGQAGAICEPNKAGADRAFKREFADLEHRTPTLAESQQTLATVLPIIRDSGAAIAKLVPPEGDEERIESYLTAHDRHSRRSELVLSERVVSVSRDARSSSKRASGGREFRCVLWRAEQGAAGSWR